MLILMKPRITTHNGNDFYQSATDSSEDLQLSYIEVRDSNLRCNTVFITMTVKHAHQFDTGFAPIGQGIIITATKLKH